MRRSSSSAGRARHFPERSTTGQRIEGHSALGSAYEREERSEISERPVTLGALRASGWVSRSVKAEIRANAITKIRAGEPMFDGVVGYEQTVMPQLENALLAGHDTIFLGERGQAKTRMIRSLVGLLDEWMPIIAGSEIRDDPYAPVSRYARDLVEAEGDDTPDRLGSP